MGDQADQLSLAFADRHTGQQATLAAATAVHKRYRDAVETVLADLVASGRPFTADDIRQAVPEDIEAEAHSPNVLPSVLGIWAARRRIVACGEYSSRRRSRRASRNRIWVAHTHPNG